jgi:hypothetical protein
MFSVDIELLIEGMNGAFDCVDYVFHEDRGYGKV